MRDSRSREDYWKREGRRFDAIAGLYDVYRPGYPEEMVASILSRSAITAEGCILEIGCGTGIATLPFARRGYAMVCVDPGQHLVAAAREKLKEFPRVEFAVSTFEEWAEPESAFDLAISGQAFHWVDKEIGFPKIARALKPGGWMAAFWNLAPDDPEDRFEVLNEIYGRLAPELKITKKNAYLDRIRERRQEFIASAYFEPVEVLTFPWAQTYTTREYLGLLNTYSDHLRLSDRERRRLFAAIGDAIDGRWGGTLEKQYVMAVILGRISK